MEDLLADSSVHACIRSTLDSEADIELDAKMGFTIVPAALYRTTSQCISPRRGGSRPAFAPGTAGPASGSWTPREILQLIIEALPGLNVVAADVVEVLPALDQAEITGITAAEMSFEVSMAPIFSFQSSL
ncbi:protein related to agmatinase [Akanthomyces lecanii RCEF 1005]|uniref:Protein related to agmatinase n=1 Tax=Akanthomyces lecanii RCEF 1005 TaxID=1081108 RepID=A0A168DJY6_CORDF|nr:protein related to agmatinase [Akanthomyces lecanii RCEF 1005]